jgi:NADH dehydrogenase
MTGTRAKQIQRGHTRTVIVGGGFGGLRAAAMLGSAAAPVTLIDRRNFHLFQPLLYQVATGGLSPGDISAPIRSILRKHGNTSVLQAEVTSIITGRRVVVTRQLGEIEYDTLIVAAGVRHAYFGNDPWEPYAPGLKTIEDALEIRRRILQAFEAAEAETDPGRRQALMTFVVIGGGPTGVELAGALAELANATLRHDFRSIDPSKASILLLEGGERILQSFPERLAFRAARSLEHLGVTILTRALVTKVADGVLDYTNESAEDNIRAATVLWAAGVQASPLGQKLAGATGVALDGNGRVRVDDNLAIPGHPDIYVIGDLAAVLDDRDNPLPGIAPVAMQQGGYVAQRILGREHGPFRYRNKGNLAVIGRNAAIADFGRMAFTGRFAWLTWVLVHIWYLIEFDNKIVVMVQWAMNYFTRKHGARLITNEPEEKN